jgi:hypothetical protein
MAAAEHLGQVAYLGYFAFTGGKTFDGRDMPPWKDLPARIRLAWGAAAARVLLDLNIAPHGRCGECFRPLEPLPDIPSLCMCPVHRQRPPSSRAELPTVPEGLEARLQVEAQSAADDEDSGAHPSPGTVAGDRHFG